MNQKNTEERQEERKNIEEFGSINTHSKKGNIHCLTIIGQIEGHMLLPSDNKTTKYEHVLPQIVSVEEDEQIDGMLILLNTMGGDVEAGLAISEMISGMSKPTVSIVLGGGHSIGVPLAVSADDSFIVPTATMTVHPIRTNGMIIGVEQSFRYFQNMQERIIEFIVSHSSVSYQTLKEIILTTDEIANDVGSILFATKAVEIGLIHQLGGIHDAIQRLYEMIQQTKN